MATRIEKIFRTNTVLTMNNILNEVCEVVATLKDKPKDANKEREQIKVLLRSIAKTVDKFFQDESVTDEELQRAIKKGK